MNSLGLSDVVLLRTESIVRKKGDSWRTFYLVKDENQLAAFRDFVAKNAAKLQDYLAFFKRRVCGL